MTNWDHSIPIDRARMFVGGEPLSGEIQLDILKQEGLESKHTVLEIGSGAGHLAMQIVPFLKKGNYFGIEPNQWTMEENFNHYPSFKEMLKEKEASFDSNENFDPSVFSKHKTFNFIFSHSVLSHASEEQLKLYFETVNRHLKEGGKALASLRLAEKTNAAKWEYPGVTWFSKETINEVADYFSLKVTYRPDIREYYMSRRLEDEHDWIVLE